MTAKTERGQKKTGAFALMLAALMLALAFGGCTRPNDAPRREDSFAYYYSEKDGMTTIYANSVKLDDKLAGAITRLGTVDGKTGFVIAASTLYHVDADGLLKIYPAAVTNAVLSLDGRYILFATASKAFLYDHEKKNYDEIPSLEAKSVLNIALSPDGKTAALTIKNADDEIICRRYADGQTTDGGQDRCIVAIANDGGACYYLAVENGLVSGRLYYEKNGKSSLVSENASPYFEVNRDLSEITFDVNERTHFSKNGEQAKQLMDSSCLCYAGEQYSVMGGSGCTTILKNASTLLNSVFYSNIIAEDNNGNRYDQYDVYFANPSASAVKLVGGASQFSVSEDGMSILCVVDDSLYKISAYNPQKPQLIASGVYSYCCSKDFSEIYTVDNYANLRRIQSGSTSPILVTGVEAARLTSNGVCLAYSPLESGGTLVWVKGDSANVAMTNVKYYDVYEKIIICFVESEQEEGTFDAYISVDGENFELGVESVRLGG